MSPNIARKSVTFVIAIGCAATVAWSGYRLVASGAHSARTVRPFVLERQVVFYADGAQGTEIRREAVGRRSDGTLFTKVMPIAGGVDAEDVRTLMLADGQAPEVISRYSACGQ